jgi:hypothetical protein
VRAGNILVVALGGAALLIATWIAWRGRRLPVLARRDLPDGAGGSALDALRTVAAIIGAGAVAGVLVAGLGGRLFMRVMAATSGNGAQGASTDAEEIVGEITFGGTLGFVIFVGLFFPIAAALVYLALRHFLPSPIVVAGLMFGVLLLGTFGVDDPMSSDNVDFEILSPLLLAVAGITALALLFGMTFSVLATRFDAGLRPLGSGWAAVPGHAGLLVMVFPPFALFTVVYMLIRTIARGRTEPLLEKPVVRTGGLAVVVLGTAAAAIASVAAALDIL